MQHIKLMLVNKTISEDDLELFLITDSVEEAVDLIKKCITRFGLSHKKPNALGQLAD
jgi:predicted Rossmann-fold nucleotide-binding protein